MIWLAVLGFLLGPFLHHLGIRFGTRSDLDLPVCRECSAVRPWLGWRAACEHRAPGRRELATSLACAAGFGGASVVATSAWLLPAYLLFVIVTVVLVITDLDHKLIPNRVLYPGGVIAAALLASGAGLSGRAADVPRAGLGGLAFFGLFFGVALVARGGFGFGDVKLAALLGMFAAFDSWRALLITVFFTGIIGGVPALVLLALRRAKPRDEIPYGPAMVAGSWLALAFWEQFTSWYLA